MKASSFPTARFHDKLPVHENRRNNRAAAHVSSSVSSVNISTNSRKPKASVSQISVGQEAQRVQNELAHVLQSLRDASSVAIPDANDEDTVDLSDRLMRRSADSVKLHMMKAQMRIQEENMQKVTSQAAVNTQQSVKLSAESEKLIKNIRNLKAFEAQQVKKIQDLHKEVLDANKSIGHLVKEVGRAKAELKCDAKSEKEEKEKLSLQHNSWDRLLAQNETLKSDVQAAKEDNRRLQEVVGQQQRRLQENKRRHLQDRKRCMNVIQKRQMLVDLLRKRRDQVENCRMLQLSEAEFKAAFRPSSSFHDEQH
ncbi:uncharacterized protein LOC129594110 [Paramacrobiotus metropolitanus]|uniref:uncharacterized protein LOC129594110 n=1 Tax=Paramacrobiotus metropolitanus TaxID=2943436 RepID=UPI002445BB3A|nr:uncharacterized protein LOC129594110 [Paramacrobiotus metropolitanus]